MNIRLKYFIIIYWKYHLLEILFRFAIHPNRGALVARCPMVGGEEFHRIVGGEDALIGQYPWLALLGYIRDQSSGSVTWECGGSLIGEMYVLTVAHCINDYL